MAGLAAVVLGSVAHFLMSVRFAATAQREVRRRAWLQLWCRRALQTLKLRVEVLGTPPRTGLIAANHPSFLDFLVLGSQQPVTFVGRPELREWPGGGWFARAAGTVFLDHLPAGTSARFTAQLGALVDAGAVVVLFPEGCRSGGSQVLPFLSALLAPAADAGWPVTAARIDFADRSTPEIEAKRRRPTLPAHFLAELGRFLAAEASAATLVYGSTQVAEPDRRSFARGLREEVIRLESGGA